MDSKEQWKTIKDFPGYYVSDKGRVLGISGRIMKPTAPGKNWKYYSVCLKRDGKDYRRTIHRLVAESFLPNPNNLPQVNHKDENKLNNIVENLEWCSARYNNNYGNNMRSGREKVSIARSKPVEMVMENGVKLFSSIREAARLTGLNRLCISRACNGKGKTAGGFAWRYSA